MPQAGPSGHVLRGFAWTTLGRSPDASPFKHQPPHVCNVTVRNHVETCGGGNYRRRRKPWSRNQETKEKGLNTQQATCREHRRKRGGDPSLGAGPSGRGQVRPVPNAKRFHCVLSEIKRFYL